MSSIRGVAPRTSGPFRRAILLVLDSLGIGALPDAAAYGDEGSDTLGNIARRIRLRIPTLARLGLAHVARLEGLSPAGTPAGAFGRMRESSPGKDSVTGHWELAGIVLDKPFPVFPGGFPTELIAAFEARIGRPTIGNTVASGTRIIDELGPQHLRTGAPIVYTSADSVFQIAAHEAVVPIDELYRYCEIAFELASAGLGVGRVIARPFAGEPGRFTRTAKRRDFALPPSGRTVLAIGKIEDLFAGRGVTRAVHTASDTEGMDQLARTLDDMSDGLVFVNLVDCDTLYGHRNDIEGYAANLERFDQRLAVLLPRLCQDDLLIVTADHGNDPTTPSTDHSREYVPVLATGPRVVSGVDLGLRDTFADVGQTVADLFGVGALAAGTSFLTEIAGGDARE
jgi:phosphopentomutase